MSDNEAVEGKKKVDLTRIQAAVREILLAVASFVAISWEGPYWLFAKWENSGTK
jgi:hypothetical protein